jgi:hypothetical protein
MLLWHKVNRFWVDFGHFMTGILIRQKVPTPCIKGGLEETIELHDEIMNIIITYNQRFTKELNK